MICAGFNVSLFTFFYVTDLLPVFPDEAVLQASYYLGVVRQRTSTHMMNYEQGEIMLLLLD